MVTNDIVKDIIKSSIEHVICIDDEFSLPYEGSAAGTNFELTKKLYEGLSKKYDCMVDIVRYEESVEIDQYASKFERKDLAVLDWELSKGAPEYQATLECLEKILLTDIPFICIYTNEPDDQRIYNQIRYYFSGLLDKNKQNMIDTFYENVLDEDDDLKKLHDQITTWSEMCVPTKENNKVLGEVKKLFEAWKSNSINIYNDIEINDLRKCLHLYTIMKKRYLLPKTLSTSVSVVKIPNAEQNIGALNINGKVLIVLHKRIEKNRFGVSPDELLERYSLYLAEEPNNLFNIVWLHYKNKLNRIIFKQGEFFQDISQEAFLYHKEVLDKEGEGLDNFIKMLYQDELINKLKLADDLYDQGITDILAACEKKDVNENELANLNYYYSINQNNLLQNKGITFGDIFQEADIYYICITALCDCLRASDKIKCNYCFVEGHKVSDEVALSNSEKGFYSFIKEKNSDKCISICWDTHKLLTIHVPLGESDKNEVEVYVRGKKVKLKYVCNQKQNYTQRVANDVFSWANRVGVTYAKLGQKIEEGTEIARNEAAVTLN